MVISGIKPNANFRRGVSVIPIKVEFRCLRLLSSFNILTETGNVIEFSTCCNDLSLVTLNLVSSSDCAKVA